MYKKSDRVWISDRKKISAILIQWYNSYTNCNSFAFFDKSFLLNEFKNSSNRYYFIFKLVELFKFRKVEIFLFDMFNMLYSLYYNLYDLKNVELNVRCSIWRTLPPISISSTVLPRMHFDARSIELIVLCKINRIANPKGLGTAHCAMFRFAVLDAKVQKVGFKAKRDRSPPTPLEREIIRKLRARTM